MTERIEVNLLPAEYRIHKTEIRLPREVFYPAAGLVVLAFVLLLVTLGFQNQITQKDNEIGALEQKIAQNKPIQTEIKRLQQDKQSIQEKIRALERINVNREKWVRLMEVLSDKLPQFTWIISIKEEARVPPVLHIEGRTFSFPEVANFMSRLKESEYILSVDLSNIEQIDPKEKMFRFSISCTINPDVKLDVLDRSR